MASKIAATRSWARPIAASMASPIRPRSQERASARLSLASDTCRPATWLASAASWALPDMSPNGLAAGGVTGVPSSESFVSEAWLTARWFT